MGEILTSREVAERLKVPERALAKGRAYPSESTPPYIKWGRRVRYDWDEVQAWLKTRARGGTGEKKG
jgi:hypothetical protein